MDGRSKNYNAFLFHLLLIIHGFHDLLLLPIVLPVFVIYQIPISLVEIQRINGPLGGHLLMLNRKIHLCWVFLVTTVLLIGQNRSGSTILSEGRIAQQLVRKLF